MINYAEKYFINHFSYLNEIFKWNGWYFDSHNLLHIHYCGLPVYINLDRYCHYDEDHPSRPVMDVDDFIYMIEDIMINTRNHDFSDEAIQQCEEFEKSNFSNMRDSLRSLYFAKMEESRKIFQSSHSSLGVIIPYMREINNISTPLSNSYGYFDEFDKFLVFHTEDYPQRVINYELKIQEDVNLFHRQIYHMLNKTWVCRQHIQLMFSSHNYITKNSEVNLYTY